MFNIDSQTWPRGQVLRRGWPPLAALVMALVSTGVLANPVVKVVLGAPPGSAPDVVARTVVDAMTQTLGQPVVVENKPGAGGSIATTAVAAAQPDGNTLNISGCSGDSISFAFQSQGRPPLVLFKDLTPVARLMRDHWLVLVSATEGARSLDALREQGTAQPLAYPSMGEGSTPHLQAARLARQLGIRTTHVPYKDSPMNDLAAGRLAYAVMPSASAVGLLKSGKLRALAVLSSERLAGFPETPTAIEAGLANYTFNGGLCAFVPAATPANVQERLNRSLTQVLARDEVRSRFATLGADPTPLNLQDSQRYVTEFAAESDTLRSQVFAR